MKYKRHKRKESFSILLVSNTGGISRQLQFSKSVLYLLLAVLLLICGVIGWMIWQLSSDKKIQIDLQNQLSAQLETVEQLEAEMETLANEKKTIEKQNMDLLMAVKGPDTAEVEAGAEEETPEPETSSTFPSLYPSSETGMLIATYSEEEPYLSINTHVDDHIIAAGDGTVVVISSDDTYPVIMEIEHESGHRTRYMCRQNAEKNAEIGAHVSAGDTIMTITADNTQLDYQVIFEGEIIDPFNVIDAKG